MLTKRNLNSIRTFRDSNEYIIKMYGSEENYVKEREKPLEWLDELIPEASDITNRMYVEWLCYLLYEYDKTH